METECLPVPSESKVIGTTTSLLPVTDMSLQIEKIPTSSSGRQRVIFHIGPRLLVDLDRNLSFISSLYMSERKHPANSYSGDSLASSNGSVKPMENGFGPHTPEDDSKVKKRVNICTEEQSAEMIVLRRSSETSDSAADKSVTSVATEKCLTMTGTIKRGKKAGQNLDVRLNISREELEVLEANIASKENQSCAVCGFTKGPHIFLWTVLCLPVATIISSIYSFYIGTLMWYNIFTYVTEEKNLIYRILLSPLLILLYPFIIVLFTLGLGFYAGIIQISWYLDSWSKEITDWEKGFYGWLCSTIGLEDCSPYEVVVLTDIQVTTTIQEPPSKYDSQHSIPDINS